MSSQLLKRVFHDRRLGLILILYLILAVTYSIAVPIGRGADEWAHYRYAQFIAQHGRLPANPAEREAAGYKSDWPPLYHLFAAGLTAWIETDGPPTFKYRAENIRRQLVPAFGPEAILHTEDELFPWQQEILIWHLGRFLSIGFSLGTLLITYYIALEVFTEITRTTHHAPVRSLPVGRTTFALAATAILAFNPRFLFTGMLFNYDSLTLLLASLFLWLAIRVAKGYHARWGFWGLGALAGLALLTKYLAALLPLVIIFLAFVKSAGLPASKIGRRSIGLPFTLRPLAVRLLQAALPFILVTSGWFGYLLVNFNEIDTYGPVLGTLAPLLRGDGSDRTVEQIFAFLSGGQAPVPAHIEIQRYTPRQVLTELPTTFWGNPITRPYPLNWFIGLMTGATVAAVLGLVISWRTSKARSQARLLLSVLLLHCALPLPFMVVRLFGARDALEAVQGRHILFLAGPAFAVLLVWGIRFTIYDLVRSLPGGRFAIYDLRVTIYDLVRSLLGGRFTSLRHRSGQVYDYTFPALRSPLYALRFTLSALLALLLIGTVSQLIFMRQTYPPLLPVRTTPYRQVHNEPPRITLDGGARLIDYRLDEVGSSLKVSLIWQAGQRPPLEDYRLELALVEPQGEARSGWLSYQTQAGYPTRTWENGDVIRDEGWLPLPAVPADDYTVRLRLLGQAGEVVPWQTLAGYRKDEDGGMKAEGGDGLLKNDATLADEMEPEWILWHQGETTKHPPTLRERETAQFTLADPQSPISNLQSPISNLQLIGPDAIPRLPASTGPTWTHFIIGPDWPAGDYRLQNENEVVLRVAPNGRNFTVPAEMTVPLEANFAGQIKLLGYHLPTRRVQPGEGLPVTLYWQGLQWMGQDFVIFDRLLDNQQVAWGGYDRLAREDYSTLLWAPGEIVTDGFAVPVAADAPDGVYTLSLGWYQRINGEAHSLPIIDPETGAPTDMTAVTIGPIKVGGPPPGAVVTEAVPQNPVKVSFGDQFELIGFNSKRNAQNLELSFYWRAQRQPEADYSVFVHVRNQTGETVTQKDQLLTGGFYPSTLWDTGEIIKDDLNVPLNNLAAGRYHVVVGLYDFASGQRLSVEGAAKNEILLAAVEIES